VESIEWQRFVQAVLQERQRADSAVQVSLENGSLYRPGDNVYLLHDLQRLRDFAERYDLALTFDTSHAASSTNPLLEAFQLVSKRVVNFHFSDVVHRAGLPNWPVVSTVLRHHQMPGSGLLPLAELLRQALHSSYDGLCTLEVSPIAIQAWSLARVRQGLADVVRFIRGVEGDGPSAA
jgi:sugar phosphate isomerase/epimerase